MAKPRGLQTCVVPIRLGPHAGLRRIGVHVTVDRKLIPGPDRGTVWGEATPPERVELFLSALRNGVPKLHSGADPSVAQITASAKREQGDVMTYDIELALPPIGCRELAPLSQILATSSLSGTVAATIEELAVAELRECGEMDTGTSTPPFKFKRATARDRIGMATLALEFESDLDDEAGKQLERWVTAWFSLVEAGAFFIRSAGTPSYGAITEVVDPYPDTWTFHCEHLVVDDAACAPLLERLADVHRVHPIKKATLG